MTKIYENKGKTLRQPTVQERKRREVELRRRFGIDKLERMVLKMPQGDARKSAAAELEQLREAIKEDLEVGMIEEDLIVVRDLTADEKKQREKDERENEQRIAAEEKARAESEKRAAVVMGKLGISREDLAALLREVANGRE